MHIDILTVNIVSASRSFKLKRTGYLLDPNKDPRVEKHEGDDGDDASDDQPAPVDVIPEEK